MTDKELINYLKDYAKSSTSGAPYVFNPGLALIIANRMEQLVSLAENGQSAIDTNQRLVAHIDNLKTQLNGAIEDIKTVFNTDDVCLLCKHYIKCEGKDCECYMSGYGLEDENGNYIPWSWSCIDFNFGECSKLKNTPCNGCDFINNFEWRGLDDIKN